MDAHSRFKWALFLIIAHLSLVVLVVLKWNVTGRLMNVCLCLSVRQSISLPRTRTRFGERGFSYCVPAAWNTLPSDLHDITDTLVRSENDSRVYFMIVLTITDYCWRSWTCRIAAPYKFHVDWLIDWSVCLSVCVHRYDACCSWHVSAQCLRFEAASL